jgi:hypothetical protein
MTTCAKSDFFTQKGKGKEKKSDLSLVETP